MQRNIDKVRGWLVFEHWVKSVGREVGGVWRAELAGTAEVTSTKVGLTFSDLAWQRGREGGRGHGAVKQKHKALGS